MAEQWTMAHEEAALRAVKVARMRKLNERLLRENDLVIAQLNDMAAQMLNLRNRLHELKEHAAIFADLPRTDELEFERRIGLARCMRDNLEQVLR